MPKRSWEDKLDGDLKKQKGKRAYIVQMSKYFGPDGFLEDDWGGTKIHVLVQNDYRPNTSVPTDNIELSSSALAEIMEALRADFDEETINSVKDEIKIIPHPIAFYVLNDEESGSGNVFSWDLLKTLNNAE